MFMLDGVGIKTERVMRKGWRRGLGLFAARVIGGDWGVLIHLFLETVAFRGTYVYFYEYLVKINAGQWDRYLN